MQGWQDFFGARRHTPGAQLQLPRRVPLRIEPKSFFANERTYLSWISMAILLGGVSTFLVGFASNDESDDEVSGVGSISKNTSDLVTLFYVPLSICMVGYSFFTFIMRQRYMEKKEMGFYYDTTGPVVLAVMIMITLVVITIVAMVDYFT
eukprot:TRINITY_DN51221_c0_g1_i1.p2 TRINITY_DN51221_c0_g1~~TRINITY_DN51221_c0_g1_i1.p2  ORF type:complete len:150 (+),score=24.10 TRINITY_DN51221_c0_g1_i1:131-580(+)